jgi:hypothetical protein
MSKEFDITIHYVYGFGDEKETGFVVGWGAKNCGFGQLTISGSGKKSKECRFFPDQTEWYCDSEDMNRDFVKQVLAKLGDVVKLKYEEEKDE